MTVTTGVEATAFEDLGDLVLRDAARCRGSERSRPGSWWEPMVPGPLFALRSAKTSRARSHDDEWLVVDARNVPGSFDHIEFLCDRFAQPPTSSHRRAAPRWEFMLRPGETRDQVEREETIRELLAPWDPEGVAELERVAVYRFHARSCAAYRSGNLFLAGDAAHVTPPFAGQGLVSGLRDALNLAWKLAWVVRGWAGEPILDSYDEERRPHVRQMIGLARFAGALIMPRNRIVATLIHGALRVGSGCVVRRYVTEMRMKPRNEFSRVCSSRDGVAFAVGAGFRNFGLAFLSGDPNGIRTRVAGMKTRCPGPD